MTSTLSVPFTIDIVVHLIEDGGNWAEVPRFPGCVAQAETLEALKDHLIRAVEDWLSDSPEKTEDEARRLPAIQGSSQPADESYPLPYEYRPFGPWSDGEAERGREPKRNCLESRS